MNCSVSIWKVFFGTWIFFFAQKMCSCMSSTEKYMGEMRFPKTKNGFTSSSSIAALIGMTERRAIHQGRDLPASVMIIRIIQRVQLAKIKKFMSLSV